MTCVSPGRSTALPKHGLIAEPRYFLVKQTATPSRCPLAHHMPLALAWSSATPQESAGSLRPTVRLTKMIVLRQPTSCEATVLGEALSIVGRDYTHYRT